MRPIAEHARVPRPGRRARSSETCPPLVRPFTASHLRHGPATIPWSLRPRGKPVAGRPWLELDRDFLDVCARGLQRQAELTSVSLRKLFERASARSRARRRTSRIRSASLSRRRRSPCLSTRRSTPLGYIVQALMRFALDRAAGRVETSLCRSASTARAAALRRP